MSRPGASRLSWVWPGLLVAAILVVFGRVVTFDFVRWDDDINITQNPLFAVPWSWELLAKLFESDQAMRFKPLHWLLDLAVHRLFGFDPRAWHALNLVLHALAAGLFFIVLRRIFRLHGGVLAGTAGERVAGLAAALWALHPLRAEPVAWATASTYPFTAVWLLASFACYVEAVGFGRGRRWLAASWLAAVAAYASYPVGLSYAFFLVAADEWLRAVRRRDGRADVVGSWRIRGARYAGFFLPAVAAAGFTLWTRYTAPGIFVAAPAIQEVDVGTRGAMALASLAHLAGRVFWPGAMTPNVPPLALSGATLVGVFGLAVIALLGLFAAWRGRVRQPGAWLVASGFVALSLPCLGLTERPTWPVDRYAYIVHLPLVGGVVGGGVLLFNRGRQRAALVLLPLAVVVSAVAAYRQAGIWRNSGTLFAQLEREPGFGQDPRQQAHVYALWASHEGGEGRADRARELFGRANDVFLAAMRNAVARGDYEEALQLSADFTRYFSLTPSLRRERGAWLLRLGKFAAARTELQAAQAAAPDDPRVAELLRAAIAETAP
ncbi:MAG: hypothetical protein JNL92_00405 [Opitutaceae bacterium]|nr:hypothetical protein [Opitutaceae bacterium]